MHVVEGGLQHPNTFPTILNCVCYYITTKLSCSFVEKGKLQQKVWNPLQQGLLKSSECKMRQVLWVKELFSTSQTLFIAKMCKLKCRACPIGSPSPPPPQLWTSSQTCKKKIWVDVYTFSFQIKLVNLPCVKVLCLYYSIIIICHF